MITVPRLNIPVPDGIALRVALHLPAHIQAAVGEVAEAVRLYAACRGPQYTEARQLLEARIARANKILAARNPGLVVRPGGLPANVPSKKGR